MNPQHTFQVLTKRGDRLAEVADRLTWTPNIWMGVSVENDRVLDRIDGLRSTPAHIKFLVGVPRRPPYRRHRRFATTLRAGVLFRPSGVAPRSVTSLR